MQRELILFEAKSDTNLKPINKRTYAIAGDIDTYEFKPTKEYLEEELNFQIEDGQFDEIINDYSNEENILEYIDRFRMLYRYSYNKRCKYNTLAIFSVGDHGIDFTQTPRRYSISNGLTKL